MTQIKISHIIRATAQVSELPIAKLLSSRRDRDIVKPRQVAMLIAYEQKAWSMPHIGRRFGNRDHTTVLHAVRTTRARLLNCTPLRELYEEIKGLASVMAERPYDFRTSAEDKTLLFETVPKAPPVFTAPPAEMFADEAPTRIAPPARAVRPSSTESNSWLGGWPSDEERPSRANVGAGNAIGENVA